MKAESRYEQKLEYPHQILGDLFSKPFLGYVGNHAYLNGVGKSVVYYALTGDNPDILTLLLNEREEVLYETCDTCLYENNQTFLTTDSPIVVAANLNSMFA
mmetsp:Transcript_16000/g.19856  ORF Transcript_16000/g.19856 Transcript_16000/m.19856 type:complete len:101 (-) Transcript_16000:1717-2019(-)